MWAAALCLVVFCLAGSPAASQEKPISSDQVAAVAAGPSEQTLEDVLQSITHPTPWLSWGGDLRVRETFYHNVIDMMDEFDDTRHFVRFRARLWATVGPFFKDESIETPNGLTAYVRITAEPRYFIEHPAGDDVPTWTEVVLDNAWVEWARLAGLPVTIKVGRQDMIYGRGFVILDGTPLDASRTICSDAIKLTVHLDDVQTTLDLFYISNEGRPVRVRPYGYSSHGSRYLAESDVELFGAYLINRSVKNHEFHAYYIYKQEDTIGPYTFPDRTVHTVGALGQGAFPNECATFDYYGELGFQWGREGRASRRAMAAAADLGCTLNKVPWTPRFHAAYTFLSGDDPGTGRFEGWDPVLGRWPQFGEIVAYRMAAEYGRPGFHSNLTRYGAGVQLHPMPKMCVSLDYNFLRANEHDNAAGSTFPFAGGKDRGHLFTGLVAYEFTPRISGHVCAEYLAPGSYYDKATDRAYFMRWELCFKL